MGIKSIVKKTLMALSGFFLLFFLLQHFAINLLSIFSADAFNEVSHFMGTNPLVQFALQPVLIGGILFHFIWGIYLELENKKARPIKYEAGISSKGSLVSKNMIVSGLVVLIFMAVHFVDFFFPELQAKYFGGEREFGYTIASMDRTYFEHLVHEFANPLKVILYLVGFFFLGLHVNHGFQSSFQTVGASHPKYTPVIQKIGFLYSVVIPAGFAFIAVYHFLNQ